mmetsp:Transcript_73035/g.237497  ORF Transcript_73035/g.237497 Transcript_73035/m.237497 type:complete len:118 (-) Transcript_73035:854-1207(-)
MGDLSLPPRLPLKAVVGERPLVDCRVGYLGDADADDGVAGLLRGTSLDIFTPFVAVVLAPLVLWLTSDTSSWASCSESHGSVADFLKDDRNHAPEGLVGTTCSVLARLWAPGKSTLV